MMAAITCSSVRSARRILFHVFFLSACLQLFVPTGSGSSLSLLSVAASDHETAVDATIGGELAEEEYPGMMADGLWRRRQVTDKTKSTRLIDPVDEPVSPPPGMAAHATPADVFAAANWAPSDHTAGVVGAHSLQHEEEGEVRLDAKTRRRLRHHFQPSRQLDGDNNNEEHSGEHDETATAEGGSNVVESSDGYRSAGHGAGMVKFRMGGRVESFMASDVMQDYLNQLVEESVAATENQTCNIAFVKTHKTASTTAATIFYRYGKRHNLNVANFDGHQSSIQLSEAVKKTQESGKRVDLFHYHFAWDGFYEGRWDEVKAAYSEIMRNPSDIKLVTVMREPVAHFLSYYSYFLQPETGLSITEYVELTKNPDDPRYETAFQRRDGRRSDVGWHGFKLLHNPLCAEFGIRTAQELEEFIRIDLPEFAMVLLTERFEEGLAIFMRMFNWRPIDMTYCKVIETKAGVERFDGMMLSDVPKIRDLPQEVINEIKQQTQLDQALYKAAVEIYLEKRVPYEDRLEADVQQIRTVQSAVHGYLNFDAMSPAHEWYEGDVHCFADPSPVQPF